MNRLRTNYYSPLTMPDVHHLFAEAALASPAGAERDAEILMGIEPFTLSADTKHKSPWFPNPRFFYFLREVSTSKEQQQAAANAAH